MGTTVTKLPTNVVGREIETTYKLVSDAAPAAQTLTSDDNRPIASWDAEGATVAAVAGTQSQLSVTGPASKTVYVRLRSREGV